MAQRGMDEFQCVVRAIGKKRAEDLAKSLGRGERFLEVLRSEIGQMLLDELVETITKQTRNLVDGKYTPHSQEETDCRAEIRVAKRVLDRWVKRLSDHESQLERWDKNSQGVNR